MPVSRRPGSARAGLSLEGSVVLGRSDLVDSGILARATRHPAASLGGRHRRETGGRRPTGRRVPRPAQSPDTSTADQRGLSISPWQHVHRTDTL
ncbi:hypothetical protein B2J93_3399 [Marssonina coronariae]|uniref:Uncharacterized protein n=1 Tax=Diplocarpon coronariae TaxID=2795749 RepID=A0A218Z8P5_9HELO|nr:hypothetical protein B2J93_3399 [Marssonina coronariae]